MIPVEPLRRSERQTHAVQTQRIVAPNAFEARKARPGADEILRMDLKPTDSGASRLELAEVWRSQADPDRSRDACRFLPLGHRLAHRRARQAFGIVLPPWILAQVPTGT